MFRGQRPCAFLLFALLSYAVATAQEKPSLSPQPTSPPITVAASGARVRFAAIGAVERMRLEVFDPSGSPVFDTGFKPGNVRDWPVVGTDGRLLPDSTYLCVVTVREVSGRLSFKQGTILVEDGQRDIGLVAEEVGLVDPLLVTRNEAGEIKGVKYDRLPVLLIKAVQEQQEQLKRQQAEIEALKQLVCPAHPNAAVCKQGR